MGVVCGLLAALFFVLNSILFNSLNTPLNIFLLVYFVGIIISGGMIYYKNVSFAIARRLLKEVNVIMILVLGICIFTIDCVKLYNSFSPINGFIYLFGTFLFLFLD